CELMRVAAQEGRETELTAGEALDPPTRRYLAEAWDHEPGTVAAVTDVDPRVRVRILLQGVQDALRSDAQDQAMLGVWDEPTHHPSNVPRRLLPLQALLGTGPEDGRQQQAQWGWCGAPEE